LAPDNKTLIIYNACILMTVSMATHQIGAFEVLKPPQGLVGRLEKVIITSDSQLVILVDNQMSIHVRSIGDRVILRQFQGVTTEDNNPIIHVLPGDTRLLLGERRGSLKVVCLLTANIVHDFRAKHRQLRSVVLSHDKKFIISSYYGKGGWMKLWDAETYKFVAKVDIGKRVEFMILV
jgi:hypothetical protein